MPQCHHKWSLVAWACPQYGHAVLRFIPMTSALIGLTKAPVTTAIPRPGHQFDQDWRLLSLNWQAQRDASTNERYTYGWMWLLDADVIQAWIGALVMQKVFLVFYSGNNQWFQWFLPCRRCFLCTMFGSALLMTVEENFRCTFCDLNEMSQE